MAEVRRAEGRPTEVRLHKVRLAEDRPAEGRPIEVRPDEVRFSSLLKNLEMESFLVLADRCWGGAVDLDVIF